MTHPCLPAPRWLTVVLAAAAAGAAAETSPWYVGVSQGFTYEDNVYRLAKATPTPPGLRRGDTVSTTSLLAGFDQPVGRQRLHGTAALRANRFADNGSLNHEGYGLEAGWDWATAERWSGTFSLAANRTLARFDDGGLLDGSTTRRNIERSEQAGATVRVGLVTRLSAEAAVSHRRVSYSAAEFDNLDNRQTGVSAGLRWRPAGSLSLGAGLRRTEGTYPNFARDAAGNRVADRFARDDLDLLADWDAGGASRFDARLSFGRTGYDVATERDFSGATGVAHWYWQPSGRLKLTTRLSRETGQDSYFLDNSLVNGVADYSRTTTALRVRADYEVSAKIAAYAAVGLAARKLVSRATTPDGATFTTDDTEHVTELTLGATWAPTRTLQFGCSIGHEDRSGGGTLAPPLRAGSIGCFGQWLLR